MVVWAMIVAAACAEPPHPAPRAVIPHTIGPEPPQVRHYVAGRAVDAVRVDGMLDEATWTVAFWTETFVDIEGDRRPVPRHRTRVAMAWDDQALYLAAVLEEPHLWGTIRQRDAVIFHDNDFEVFLDPDGDSHAYYELEINALGTVWDLFLDRPYRDGGSAVDSWDIEGLASAVRLEGSLNDPSDVDIGWTVELAIPWAGLTGPDGPELAPLDGESWRVNFSRVQWRLEANDTGYTKVRADDGEPLPEDNWVWSPQDAINMHMPEMWGVVHFSGLPVGQSRADLAAGVDDVPWLLRRVYYAQRRARSATGGYVGAADRIGIDGDVDIELVGTDGYRATAGAGTHVWTIDQHGRVWRGQDRP
jgi:hypothetical protein